MTTSPTSVPVPAWESINNGIEDASDQVGPVALETWAPNGKDALAIAADGAGAVYQSSAFHHVFTRILQYQPYGRIARDDTTGEIRGTLALYQVPGIAGGCRLVGVPFRDRGGILWRDVTALRALLAEAGNLADDVGARWLELKTLEPIPPDVAADLGFRCLDHWISSRVDLRHLEETAFARRLGGRVRNKLAQGERAGLRVSEATGRSDALDTWYRLHLTTQRHLGLPPFPRSFFGTLFDGLGNSGDLRFFLVETRDGEVIAASIVLRDGGTALYAYSASHPDRRDLRPNDLMLFRILMKLAAEGIGTFDFGCDAPSQQSLLAFKRKWLAVQRPVCLYLRGKADCGAADSEDARYRLARAVVRRMPLPLVRLGLAPLARYFG